MATGGPDSLLFARRYGMKLKSISCCTVRLFCLRIIFSHVVESELQTFGGRPPVVRQRAGSLMVIERGDFSIIGFEKHHGFSDRDFFLSFIIADPFEVGLHETLD